MLWSNRVTLKLLIENILVEVNGMKTDYKVLGDYIQLVDQRNRDLSVTNLLGVSIEKEKISAGGVFSGEKVVLTGSLNDFKRDEASKIIESLGGQIMSGVSKNVTLVLAGEEAGSKLEKATALNIKIITEDDFKLLIKT